MVNKSFWLYRRLGLLLSCAPFSFKFALCCCVDEIVFVLIEKKIDEDRTAKITYNMVVVVVVARKGII